MTIYNDKKDGLIKTTWEEIRAKVMAVEPTFAKIVDSIRPNISMPVYLSYYPFGAIEADTKSTLLPNGDGSYFRLSDKNIPKDISENLGYGKDSSPLGMVLEKQLELYIDLPNEGITIPWLMHTPGKIFPFARILSQKDKRVYAPNGLLSSTAGARSIFMLPNIGCNTHHTNLQRDYRIETTPPKSLYEHWEVFREIASKSDTGWRCCVLYFSESWINKIHADPNWKDLKYYLHDLAWKQYEYERNRVYYDITFSIIKKKRNLKPNPYLADTAKHLFATAMGAVPGYTPAINNNAAPIDLIQKAYTESYGLDKYTPTIMHPAHYHYEEDQYPIYYSLMHSSTHVFSPKSRKTSSTLTEMRELNHILKIFKDELGHHNSLCSDTTISEIAKNIAFRLFHNKYDMLNVIMRSTEIPDYDMRMLFDDKPFAADAPFVRGCISISKD